MSVIMGMKLKNLSSAMQTCECINKIRLLAGIFVVMLIYVLLVVCYDLTSDSWGFDGFKFFRQKHSNDASVHPNETKTILFWNTMFGDKTFYFGEGDLFRNCPDVGKKCWATYERSHANVEDFDAVMFHGSELSIIDLPTTRRERQNYVFVNLESPANRGISHSRFDDNFFNLTMTYRLDSDVTWPYGHIQRFKDGSIVAPSLGTVWNTRTGDAIDFKDTNPAMIRGTWDEFAMMKMRRKKTKPVVWFVSNCRSKSGRDKYVDELAKHVDVDIYGNCGKEVGCPRNRDCLHELVEPDYYFYLSFENSMCQDYVTEKLYNALKYNVVPIVYGGANYSLFAPPRSYINALDFDSPRQLGNYLISLINQPSEYDKYFEWKKSYQVSGWNNRVICQLCQYLHESNKTKSYSPLSAWFESDKCPLQEKLKKLSYLTRKDLKN